jgi:ComEC/Rec2-related protein
MRRFRQTTLLCLACGALLFGLVWSRRTGPLPLGIMIAGVVCGTAGLRKLGIAGLYALVFAAFMVGWWRGGMVMRTYRDNLALAHHTITVAGYASSDGIYADHKQLSFDIQHARVLPDEVAGVGGEPVAGSVAVSGFGAAAVNKGDYIQVTGTLHPSRGSHTFTMGFAALQVSPVKVQGLNRIRQRFSAGMYSALPEPLGSFAMGLLIGQRSTIPKDLYDMLTVVGLTHIVAVSGYNLTIIISAVRRLLGKRSKFQSLAVSLAMIAGFLTVTGLSASIVRAALISTLSLLAWYYGRRIRPVLLILFTAAVTALWNPFYLWSDIGWYLSFLAFIGILIIAPLVSSWLFGRAKPSVLAGLIIETVAAEIMTLPLIMFVFGRFSVIGLAANLVVVPFIPLAMLLSFIAGMSGMLIPAVSGWFAYPARLILTYMVDVVAILSKVPKAVVGVTLGIPAMAVLYGSVLAVAAALWKKVRKNAKITDMNQVSAS